LWHVEQRHVARNLFMLRQDRSFLRPCLGPLGTCFWRGASKNN
jgi:hypothetical protein